MRIPKKGETIVMYKVKKTSNEPQFYAKYLFQILIALVCFFILAVKPIDKISLLGFFVVLIDLIFLIVSFVSSINEIYNLSATDGRLLFEFGDRTEAYTDMEVLKNNENKIVVKASDCNNTKVKMTIKFNDYNEKIEFLNSYCKDQDFCGKGE